MLYFPVSSGAAEMEHYHQNITSIRHKQQLSQSKKTKKLVIFFKFFTWKDPPHGQ